VRIGVVGLGYVGKAVVECFGAHHEVVAWDAADATPYPREQLAACDYAVVCVPTPALDTGHCDISAVEDAVSALPCQRVLLKSTVPPGTTDRLAAATNKQLCFWPEYIGESPYYNPYFANAIEQVPFVIVGGEPSIRSWFVDVLTARLGPTKHYLQCSAIEAELAKYAENSYLATKVTFVNEFRRISEAFGADWHTVREAWLLDPRMERMHTAAFADAPGFSGKCLPKDVRAIVAAAIDAGYAPGLLQQVLASNEVIQATAVDARGPGSADTSRPPG
jgi:UDPglucose 6-dehydrogenase